jgi:glycosyltransferase involved in cell wall biosynthesis
LKDRSVQSGSDLGSVINSFPHLPDEGTGYTDICYFDIDIQLKYLELPLLLKVEKLLRKNLSLGLEIGCSLKLFLKDASNATFLREVKSADLTEEARPNFRFDYRTTSNSENYSYNGGGICPAIGTYVNCSRFHVGLRYQVDYIDWVSSIFTEVESEMRAIKNKYGITGNFILNVGVLFKRRNIPRLLKAFSMLRKDKDFDHK